MPDPLEVLPYELWTLCIAFAVAGQPSGPLELLIVSKHWQGLLLDSPSLWSRIYIQNGEDEMARISIFLHLSKSCSLHVDIMTVPSITESLQLITEHISRVTTISVRPGESTNMDGFPTEEWKLVASNILARVYNGRLPSSLDATSCFGISLRKNRQWHYCVILMQFKTVASDDQQNGIAYANLPDTGAYFRTWEEHIARCIGASASREFHARVSSVKSIGWLASQAQHYDAIRIAIPSFIELLEDKDPSILLATIDGLSGFAVHVELRDALKASVPLLVQLLTHWALDVRRKAVSVLKNLANHNEFHESLRVSVSFIVQLLAHGNHGVPSFVLETLTKHDEFHEVLMVSVSSIVQLLAHGNHGVPSTAAFVLETLTKHDEFHEVLRIAILPLVQTLRHRDPDARLAAASALENLAKHSTSHEALRLAIPSIVLLLGNKDRDVRASAASVLEILGKDVKMQPIPSRLSRVTNFIRRLGSLFYRSSTNIGSY